MSNHSIIHEVQTKVTHLLNRGGGGIRPTKSVKSSIRLVVQTKAIHGV